MAKTSIPGPDEALAGMAKVGAPREPMGKSGVAFTSPSAAPKSGTLVKKGGAQASDPAASGTGARSQVSAESLGASYSVSAKYMKQTSPEAGATQANGRRIAPAIQRSKPAFDDGIGASY